MGFVKSFEELGKMSMENLEFYDAEMLIVVWETKMEIVKRLLPPPLDCTPMTRQIRLGESGGMGH